MSLRLRFALLFTIVVAIILLLSSVTIYFFYANHRRSDFESKLKNEAIILSDECLDKQLSKIDSNQNLIEDLSDDFFFERVAIVFSGDKKIIYSNPENPKLNIDSRIFEKIKKSKEYFYKIDEKEYVGKYLDKVDNYLIVAAKDKEGINKLVRLRFILLGVFLGGILITVSISYLFVNSTLQPLYKLSNQIKQTTENNLWQKVSEGNGKDEIAQIAINYNEMMSRLKIAFEVQKNFIHHASHELRTPLTVMYATTEAALNKNLEKEEYKNVLVSLKDDQNNLIELTNSLLLLSQFEKLQFSPNWQDFRIDELIYDAIVYCKKIFPSVIIDFSFENVPEENDLIIRGNDKLLKAAFTNLIKNAFLYSTDKKLHISLIALTNKMEIDFENKGAYLSETEVENIKNPFSRGENIGLAKGIGFGLSIVQKIISLHNGNFIYLPLVNGVNRFTVKLK